MKYIDIRRKRKTKLRLIPIRVMGVLKGYIFEEV